MSLNDDLDFSPLEKSGDYFGYRVKNGDNIIGFGWDPGIIITNKIKIDDKVMESMPGLKLICVIATGYNVVDIEAAKKRNVMVVNVPQYAKYSVAQHTFALILSLSSNICSYHKDVQRGEWQKSSNFTLLKYPNVELAGKTIGIIGFGAIGMETAKISEAFNMNILVHDLSDILKYGHISSTLEEILRKSDIMSIHVPLTSKTENLITKKELQKMKNTALLINTSRGGIINETDLAWALNSGVIGGAGLDVLVEEPPKSGNPMLGDIKNLVLTPHVAWSSREARKRLIDITAENIKSFKEGNPINLVN